MGRVAVIRFLTPPKSLSLTLTTENSRKKIAHINIEDVHALTYSLLSLAGMFLFSIPPAVRSVWGGAIYQNVSPLVSANGRRTPHRPISRAPPSRHSAGRRTAGGRVPSFKIKNASHTPTDPPPPRPETCSPQPPSADCRAAVSVTDAISDSYSPAWICSERRERGERI